MEVEVIFPILALALFAMVVWGTAVVLPDGIPLGEGRAHLRLTWPLLVGTVLVSFLVGWAIEEAEPADESVSVWICVVAGLAAAVLARALLRGALSLRRAARLRPPVATVGFFRCRTVVSDEFRRAAAPEVLAAALAHEAAHVRYGDPLRIWLAQLAADIQWPIPGAARRLKAWMQALELARDDDAVTAGIAPTALAESILLAARLQQEASGATASVVGDGTGLAVRVRRLLSGDAGGTAGAPRTLGHFVRVACLVASPAAMWLGARFGDTVLAFLPGVGR